MSQPLHVAVYAIARNEARHAERFMAALSDADAVIIADTGSSDGTRELLIRLGALVTPIHSAPWRFDDARNAALALVPADVDVCVSLDLDEVVQPGRRQSLEAAWTPGTTRLRYPFVASWNSDGSPGVTFWNNRVHARAGYRWRLPVHEVVEWYGAGDEHVAQTSGFCVHHHPDEQKNRGSYLPLLEAAVRESPHDPRLSHYLGREYTYHGRHEDALRELQRSLSLSANTWHSQRAEACRLIGQSLDALRRFDESPRWYWRAVGERPDQREPWVDLASALYHRGDYEGGYYAATRALQIGEPAPDYFSEPAAWGALPHDLLANCAWHVGRIRLACEHARRAADLSPTDARLRSNVEFLERACGQAPAGCDGPTA
jgi:tetratricopeptide (TPR) repeat protein